MNSRIYCSLLLLFSLSVLNTATGQIDEERLNQRRALLMEKYQEEFGVRSIESNDADGYSGNLRADFDDIKVTDFGTLNIEEAEPSIAVNPNDPDNIVVSFIHRDEGAPIESIGSGQSTYYSFDGGETWDRSNFDLDSIFQLDHEPDPDYITRGGADPVYAFDKDGTLYCVWLYGLMKTDGSGFLIATYWGWSTDGGMTFQVAEEKEDRLLSTGVFGEDISGTTLDRPWLAVDKTDGPNSGTIYIHGSIISFEESHVYGAYFNGFGLAYKSPEMSQFSSYAVDLESTVPGFSEAGGQLQHVNLYVDHLGILHVSAAGLNAGVPQSVYHFTTSDRGETYQNLSAVSAVESAAIQSTAARESPMPDAVTNPNTEHAHMVYGAKSPDGIYGQYRQSSDNGETWSAPQDIATMLGATSEEMLFPTIAVDEVSGRLSIAYMGKDSVDVWNYYISSSMDDGATWDYPFKVTTVPTGYEYYFENPAFFGDYWETKMVGDKTYCVWTDGRSNLGSKVHVAVIDHTQLSGIAEIAAVTDQFKLVSVSPNPASDFFDLKIQTKGNTPLEIDLLSLNGQVVVSKKEANLNKGINNLQIDLPADIPGGMYLLRVKTKFGIVTRKLSIVD